MTDDDWEERYTDPWGLSVAEQSFVGRLLVGLTIALVGAAGVVAWLISNQSG